MHLLSWTVIHLIVAAGFGALLTFLAARETSRVAVLALACAVGVAGTLLGTCLVVMMLDRTVAIDFEAYRPAFAISFVAGLGGATAGLWWAREYRQEV